MVIKELKLRNFRNYTNLELEFSPKTNIIIGRNAQGKTNLLESIYFLSHLKSHKTNKNSHIISRGETAATAEVLISNNHQDGWLSVLLTEKQKTAKIGGRAIHPSKKAKGVLKCTLFSPDDLQLVKGEPSSRRSYLDEIAEMVDPSLAYILGRYSRVLSQRNAVLKKQEKYRGGAVKVLQPWTEELVKLGSQITRWRMLAVEEIKEEFSREYLRISKEESHPQLEYISPLGSLKPTSTLKEIEEIMRESLERRRGEEFHRRTTLVGPHRDDIKITLLGWEARYQASQGEQRSLSLSMRIAQKHFIQKKTGVSPVVLLDDVFSELDLARRKNVMETIIGEGQAFLTTVEPLRLIDFEGYRTFIARGGKVEPEGT
ncbi:MAG: DNA replication/repair protein RecF [Actinomycetota bacterium]|nr:DNA replication/repair protein RecF [Actinomycetota bacterium]